MHLPAAAPGTLGVLPYGPAAPRLNPPDGADMIVAERPAGTFTRQVFLGETLDADHISADHTAGVRTLTIPVHEAAKPRSIQVTSRDQKQAVTA